jgi:hypothetical protein
MVKNIYKMTAEMLVQKIRILKKVYLLKMQVVGLECETGREGCGQ